jgi:hypothetical protein
VAALLELRLEATCREFQWLDALSVGLGLSGQVLHLLC